MANESIVTGKKYRILVDAAQKLWQRVSFWTKSTDVEFNDGKTAETKVGSINGITSSLTSSDGNIALSAAAGRTLNSNLTTVTNSVNSGLNGCKITYESGAFYATYGSTKKKLGSGNITGLIQLYNQHAYTHSNNMQWSYTFPSSITNYQAVMVMCSSPTSISISGANFIECSLTDSSAFHLAARLFIVTPTPNTVVSYTGMSSRWYQGLLVVGINIT